MVPTIALPPPGGCHVPSARRKLTIPPPDAGAAPERSEVNVLMSAVSWTLLRPPNAPALLNWTWPLVPPGVIPPPPALAITNRVFAQALVLSPVGRFGQVIFWAKTEVKINEAQTRPEAK